MPFDFGLCTGANHAAKSSVSLAPKGLSLSDSHSTACGAWTGPKRSSTASSVRSRTLEPLMSVPATARQASTSRYINDEDDADDIAVPASDLEDIGVPPQVRAHHRFVAMQAALAAARMALEEKPLPTS